MSSVDVFWGKIHFMLSPSHPMLHLFCEPHHLQLIALMTASLMLFLRLRASHCHGIQHKKTPQMTVGVITYLTNVPLRVNNVEVVSRAFA